MLGLQEKAISEAEFEQLVEQLEQTTSTDRASRIATAAQFCFFTSLQVSTFSTAAILLRVLAFSLVLCLFSFHRRISVYMFTQGSTLMGTVENTFDKMDVAIALHHRLIDQTEFATLLCCLECEEDRDNVWHRILTNKAHKQPVTT